MNAQVLRFPRERVQGRVVRPTAMIYQFELRSQTVGTPLVAFPLMTWFAWSVAFCAVWAALWGR